MRVVWSATAENNLDAIWEYIAQNSLDAADRIAAQMRAAADRLASYPALGRPGRVGGTRELVVPGARYVLIYRAARSKVTILRVLHGAQQWPLEA